MKYVKMFESYTEQTLKPGDKVRLSSRNENLHKAGTDFHKFEGTVKDVWEDGSFSIKTEDSILIVPIKDGVWIYVNNGDLVFYKKKSQAKRRLKFFNV